MKPSTCIIGLGNPGNDYINTRHNIGFMLLDELRSHFNFSEFSKKFDGFISIGEIDSHKVTLFKPYQYMNNSGPPIQKLLSFYRVSCDDTIVAHDDVDLEFGRIKIKHGGGNAGHNGLRSIDNSIGKNYWRLRIGIGRHIHMDTADYVLSNFTKEENTISIIEKITSNIKLLLHEDKNLFVQQYSSC